MRLPLWVLLAATACSANKSSEEAPPAPPAAYDRAEPAPAAAMAAPARGAMARADESAKSAAPGGGGKGGEDGSEAQQKPAPTAGPRMVHYNGYIKERAADVEKLILDAVKLGDSVGGYVETQTDTSVTLRVPVARFREAFDLALKLGEVVTRSITAQDVTDAYVSIDLRAKTLRTSRDRLIALLAQARNEAEKLQILREIQRLTEDLDQLELQLSTLASLASFSRLSIEVEPRTTSPTAADDVLAFQWIRELSPFRRDMAFAADGFELDTPDGMVELDDRDAWEAQSAHGSAIWASERDNDPRGDNAFWADAVARRLGESWGKPERSTIGGFEVVKAVYQGEPSYRYAVAVRADGKHLQVVEIYFPTPDEEKLYESAVKAVLERGRS